MREGMIVVDLQFGSTGKGLLSGYLAETRAPDTLITAWAPNAGHTYIDRNGRKYVHCMVPNGIVSRELKRILIGPGSVIDPDLMWKEFQESGIKTMMYIHPFAAVVTEAHREAERSRLFAIGSTMKGVSEANIQKIQRHKDGGNAAIHALAGHPLGAYVCSVAEYHQAMDRAEVALIEGAQGYSLSMNHGFYPYTTSRDCTVLQTLSDCGIPHNHFRGGLTVYGSCRTYPIRVANRYDAEGKQIGWSGPHYPDQTELDWQRDLGMEPELTTVTKLPRRIFSWSDQQIEMAIRQNSVDLVFLNFCNYLPKEDRYPEIVRRATMMERHGAALMYLGFGPTFGDVVGYDDWIHSQRGA